MPGNAADDDAGANHYYDDGCAHHGSDDVDKSIDDCRSFYVDDRGAVLLNQLVDHYVEHDLDHHHIYVD
jgi:hypothetical protein